MARYTSNLFFAQQRGITDPLGKLSEVVVTDIRSGAKVKFHYDEIATLEVLGRKFEWPVKAETKGLDFDDWLIKKVNIAIRSDQRSAGCRFIFI